MHPIELLKAEHVGLRELKENISGYAHSRKTVIATDHGKPIKVLISYDDMVSLLETVKDLLEAKMSSAVRKGRKAIEAGGKGIPARRALERLR